jgi:heme-degrading monooxygenase HmoA
MYARSSSVRGNPRSVDGATAYVRDKVMPAVTALDGYVGLSMLADRDGGRCIATTAWETEEAMHASEGPLHQLRQRYGEILGGRPEVQEWQIAVLHRARHAPESACARVVWSRGEPNDREAALAAFRTTILPRVEELPGFCSLSLLVDLEAARAVSATVYESRDVMARATTLAEPLRKNFIRSLGGEITEVAEFDLVLAHLRVPETV